ncbi:MAG: 3-hydroxyacyl-CoA dehydrogenase / enoyl-CoA hydratase / 3-hydroxybutyryl-CoA epimerase / enoyl-CoA [Verrucomicrobiota bacterium]|nr:3-hydroxyacyl-CoA dehydrogenase / enoyl-CoA hydratase / 3-hydroxybutyryl-CoA epimerase / enoyl-CoA [Verrucomicrobiota bacterium]
MNQNIQREVTDTGIAILTFDRPDSTANIFDHPTLDELNQHVDFLESEKSLKGLIIRSAKSKIFIAGADLNTFTREVNAERLAMVIERGQKTFDRIARLPYPTVAAIHGVAVGGGFEITLACDYRIASSDVATKVGLPETNLGILPAWGGSTRLPKLIGLPNALEAIMNGRTYPAEQALKLGMVDAIVHREQLIAFATKNIQQSGGKKRSHKIHISNRPPLSKLVKSQAEKKALTRTRGHYPAPLKALEVACASLNISHEESLANEKNRFIELALTETAQNLIGIFFLQERAKKLKLPPELEPGPATPGKAINKTMVVGAGLMGAGIAQWLSSRGLRVILKDVGPALLGKGMQAIAKIYATGVKRHLFSETDARNAFDRILPIYEEMPLREIDLVIEAAIEKLDVKQQIFAELESKLPANLALATNTSALSIDAIAASLQHPERVVGIHFFNPVHRMQLVEIVRGPKTDGATLNTALRFAKQIGKLPVLVKDSPGFLVNRILLPYMVEAVRLFAEGFRIENIDRTMLDFGMPMGPLRLTDEVGLDVAEHVAKELESRVRHLAPLNDTLAKMMEKGWFGRKSGKGFYEYGSGSDEKINSLFGDLQPTEPVSVNQGDVRDRLVLLMVNEAARTIEEKVVDAPEDVDFGMIMGTGWAPFRGGPLRFADHLGISTVVSRLNNLRDRVAPYFEPCRLLADMANRGASFYPEKRNAPSTESEPKT